tara:strand:- start:15 stop:383 length:369 start_codon:yes stop_codon:yes gene_type:complete
MREPKQIICHILKFVIFAVLIILFQNCNNAIIDDSNFINKKESSKIVGDSKNGLKNGEWISYFQNGEIQSICHFKDGVPHGPIIVYNQEGDELYRGNFENGSKIGEWVFTNPETNEIIKKDY